MNLLLNSRYKLTFKSEYSVLDGYYQVLNSHTHSGVVSDDLPFEDTIDLVRTAIDSDAWDSSTTNDKQEVYNVAYSTSKNSIFYELEGLNNKRVLLVPDHWIESTNADIFKYYNMALAVDCGIQSETSATIIANLKDEVGYRLKHAVAFTTELSEGTVDADTDTHTFRIEGGRLYVDDVEVDDRSTNSFSGTGSAFLINGLTSDTGAGFEISKFEFDDKVFELDEGTGDTSEDTGTTASITWSNVTENMWVQQLVSTDPDVYETYLRLDNTQTGTTTLTPVSDTVIKITGRFLSVAGTQLMGTYVENEDSRFFFGIKDGKWLLGYGEANAPREVFVNPKTDITAYRTTWLTEDEFNSLQRRRKQAIRDSGYVDYFDKYQDERDKSRELEAQVQAYKNLLATMDTSNIAEWESTLAVAENERDVAVSDLATVSAQYSALIALAQSHNGALQSALDDIGTASDLAAAQSIAAGINLIDLSGHE